MRTIDNLLSLLSLILVGIVLWAVMPLLVKMLALANGLHRLLGA